MYTDHLQHNAHATDISFTLKKTVLVLVHVLKAYGGEECSPTALCRGEYA